MEKKLFIYFLIFLYSLESTAQYKSYIKYATRKNIRNSEGDLIVKNNGSYFAAWTQFGNNLADNASADIAAKISDDGGKNWTSLGVIQQNLGAETTISVSLLRIGGDTVHMYFCVGNSGTDLQLYRKKSTDDCTSWGPAELLINDPGYSAVLNGKVRRVSSGRIIMAMYTTADVNNIPPDYMYSYCWYSDDNGTTWSRSTPNLVLNEDIGYSEPGFFEADSGVITMNMRVQTGGVQVFSTSIDDGNTFDTPFNSTLSSTGSPASIARLSNGVIIALHNPSGLPYSDIRSLLRLSKSVDGGLTWQKVSDIDGGIEGYNFSYSSITENSGNILITYWETNLTMGRISLKFTSIPISFI